MEEVDEYGKDKKWITLTLEGLVKDMADVKEDMVGIKLQINSIVTRMSAIMVFFMILGWLAPYFLFFNKENKKPEVKTESSSKTSMLNHTSSYFYIKENAAFKKRDFRKQE